METRLSKYMRVKGDPAFATLLQLEELKRSTDQMSKQEIQKAIRRIIADYKETRKKITDAASKILRELREDSESEVGEILEGLRAKYPEYQELIVAELKEYVLANPEKFKGEKGESIKGDAGKAPTAKELKKLIETYGKGQDGKTPVPELDYPSERQVKLMVKELGKKIEERQTKAMKKMMPKVKIPTVEQLVHAIEALPEKKKLDYYRGLKNQPSNTDAQVGGGMAKGGGMGNWVHQAFSTSSATTSVTLTSNVAAGGTAILVRYNGQLLAHGVQYTISGKVISFTFTLDDSSAVDVTYVRT